MQHDDSVERPFTGSIHTSRPPLTSSNSDMAVPPYSFPPRISTTRYLPTSNTLSPSTSTTTTGLSFSSYPSKRSYSPYPQVHAHTRSHSLSETLGKMRSRAGSTSAGEIVQALKAPISFKLIFGCLIWYLASGMSNTSSKAILNAFPRPVTLTIVQFMFVSGWCIVLFTLAQLWPTQSRKIAVLKHQLRSPTREVLLTTSPLALFQIGGHIFSAIATNRIAVSLVHTIKGLSPLFTVFAYRTLYRVQYSTATYLSLIPLTIGVMLACSAEFRGNFLGVFSAFGSAIVFVSQNIFAKKLFNQSNAADTEGPGSKKLDKLNLLCYSSGIAFFLTFPLWLYAEGFTMLGQYYQEGKVTIPLEEIKHPEDALSGYALLVEFLFNGTVHFAQNIIAFILLSMISPVTYSIASLIKRVFVIVMAIIWFGQKTTPIQAAGIALTFIGLYLYDRAGDVGRGERVVKMEQTKSVDPLLPLSNTGQSSHENGHADISESSVHKI